MAVVSMSTADLNRLTIVMDLAESRLTARQAATMLRLAGRQVWRLLGVSGKMALPAWRPAHAAA